MEPPHCDNGEHLERTKPLPQLQQDSEYKHLDPSEVMWTSTTYDEPSEDEEYDVDYEEEEDDYYYDEDEEEEEYEDEEYDEEEATQKTRLRTLRKPNDKQRLALRTVTSRTAPTTTSPLTTQS